MRADRLRLLNFRNYGDCEVEFTDGTNLIFGENAAGKTNILEGVFFFAAGKSFRAQKDRDLIRFGCDEAVLSLDFSGENGKTAIGARLCKKRRKELFRDGAGITKLFEYLGAFRAVIFTPDHLSLIKGQPENRRKFADLAICQIYPRYVSYLNEYNRLLAQKNALLRSDAPEKYKRDMLAVYNEKAASSAGAVCFNRRRFLKQLEADAALQHDEISGGTEKLTLRYNGCFEDGSESAEETRKAMLSYLQSKADAEIERGMCLFGVHKDDFTVYLNGKSARLFASQGQQRSAVLALKLAEGEMSRRITGEYPVFLLDDILSELDASRQKAILEKTSGRQVIITGCGDENFNPANVENRLCVKDGKVEKV